MEQVECVSELDVFRAVLLADVERGTDFLHFLLRTKRPQTLELSVVKRQTDRKDLGEQIDAGEGSVVIIDVVYVYVWVAFDGRSDGLIPSRIKDGRRQVVHASGIWVSLGLDTEDGESKMTQVMLSTMCLSTSTR